MNECMNGEFEEERRGRVCIWDAFLMKKDE